jgi:glycosyltransferase involved in cell wall biosynthesis
MYRGRTIGVAIPALNEADSVGAVIARIPSCVDWIVVADNGSSDSTADVARGAGAIVVSERRRGYGAACLRALERLDEFSPHVVAFMDADGSDSPEELLWLLDPIADDGADLVIGSRMVSAESRLSLPPLARFGNRLATQIIKLWTGIAFTDLGPFRAIDASALRQLRMADRDFGWTVEMQLKAAAIGLRCQEVPLSYHERRGGESKVSGSLSGSVKAAGKILWTLFRYAGYREGPAEK